MIAGAMLGLAGSATAGPIVSANSGLASPAETITFSEIVLADGTPLTNQYAGLGVTFGGFYYNGCPTGCAVTPPDGAKPDIGDFVLLEPSVSSSESIAFSGPVDGAAFDWIGSNDDTSYTFTALLDGNVVDQLSFNVDGFTPNGSFPTEKSITAFCWTILRSGTLPYPSQLP